MHRLTATSGRASSFTKHYIFARKKRDRIAAAPVVQASAESGKKGGNPKLPFTSLHRNLTA